MRSWERFQCNILSRLSERLLESSKESIKAGSHSPGLNSEDGIKNKSFCLMFVPCQRIKIGTIRNVHTQHVCVMN